MPLENHPTSYGGIYSIWLRYQMITESIKETVTQAIMTFRKCLKIKVPPPFTHKITKLAARASSLDQGGQGKQGELDFISWV